MSREEEERGRRRKTHGRKTSSEEGRDR